MQNDDLLANVTEVAGSKVLPPCVILGRLGRGGMGAVYRARHLNLGIDVAVKVLKPQMIAEDPSYIARFKREGESAAAISHQNVIRVFDRVEFGGLHYIIMELVVGEDVRNRVRRKGPLAIGEAMQIVHDAAMGLGAAHALGIVHRDVKPDNLLIANTGQLKVADLGLAKPTMGSGGASLMSAANQVMGTPSYMPPEQWESPAVGPTADVWALGATLWYLLTGEEAFDSRDGNFPRVMKQIVLQRFPDVRKKRADVPDGVVAILERATANDPRERYADASELAAAIEALALPRASLRDLAPTTEAQTMVSPSPKNLDQIKQWLREDSSMRLPTPSGRSGPSGSKSDIAGPSPTPGPQPAGGTWVKTPLLTTPTLVKPASAKGRILLLAAALLLAGGGGYWAFGRGAKGPATGDAVDALAEVDRLERQGDFAGAIARLRELRRDQPSPDLDKRLAGLYSRDADRLAETKQWRGALEQLRFATQLDDSLVDRQQALRDRVKQAAIAELALEGLPARVKRGADVEVRGTFSPTFDAVRELRLADMAVDRDSGGGFRTTLKITQRTDVAIGARLVDDGLVELRRKTLEVEGDAPLAFAADFAKGEPREGELAFTGGATIAVEGTLADAETRLFVGDVEIPRKPGAAGAFSCMVPVGKEGEEVALTLVARKDGVPDASIPLGRVLRLGKPALTIRSPATGSTTDQVVLRIEVEVDRWTRRVGAIRPDRRFELQRDGRPSPPTFTGELRLLPGPNRFGVEATNAAGTATTTMLDVTCEAQPAAIAGVRLVGGDTPRPLARAQRVFVNGRESLRFEVSGTRPVLELGGQQLAIGTDVPLNGLTEGTPKACEFRVANELGSGTPFLVEFVLDTTKPVVAVTEPAEGVKVPARQPVRMRGTWKEASGKPTILVAGQPAAVVADAADSGTWTYELAGQEASRPIRVRAVDAAGNGSDLSYPLAVDPASKPEVKQYPGFTSDAESANELGFPKRIVDKDTGIALVAVDFANDSPPKLYVGATLVTVKQFDGAGADTPKLAVAGRDVDKWLLARKRRFDLLTREEWETSCKDNPDLPDARSRTGEWLKPAKWNDSTWPTCKGDGKQNHRARDAAINYAFRVVFRTP